MSCQQSEWQVTQIFHFSSTLEKTFLTFFGHFSLILFTFAKNILTEVSDAFFNTEYSEYDEFIQCTMHLKVQRIKTNAECSYSIPFVAACGIRDIHLLAAW